MTLRNQLPLFGLTSVLAMLAPQADASQVGAYTSIGLTGLADVAAPSFSGGATQDYTALPWSPPPGSFGSSLNPLGDFNASSSMQLAASVIPSPGAAATALPASASASADLFSGRLTLAASSSFSAVLDADQHALSAFTVARVGVEFGEGLELRMPYAGGTPPAPQVQWRLALQGSITDTANAASIGLWSSLRLSHVQATPGAAYTLGQERLDQFGGGTVNTLLSLNGQLIEPECSATLGFCSYWFSVYASLEGSGEVPPAGKSLPLLGAGDALDFSSATHGAQLQLLVPQGASVVSIFHGQGYAWVSAVPEAPTALMGLAGLLGLLARTRRPRER